MPEFFSVLAFSWLCLFAVKDSSMEHTVSWLRVGIVTGFVWITSTVWSSYFLIFVKLDNDKETPMCVTTMSLRFVKVYEAIDYIHFFVSIMTVIAILIRLTFPWKEPSTPVVETIRCTRFVFNVILGMDILSKQVHGHANKTCTI